MSVIQGFSDPEHAKQVEGFLKDGKCQSELFSYDTGHGFLNASPWPFDTYEALSST